MKHLYLIRHAKSSWSHPDLSDIDRPLNKRGKRDAPFMGSRLKKYDVYPDLVCTSPAKRARKTAKHICSAIGYPLERIVKNGDIYTSDLNRLLNVVREVPEDVDTLFLVGHNFVLTDLAEYLTGETLINVPTSGIVSIIFSGNSWKDAGGGRGKMEFFDYPKKHRRSDVP